MGRHRLDRIPPFTRNIVGRAGHTVGMKPHVAQRLPIVAVAVVLLVAFSAAASWQVALLGVGFVAIGVVLLLQRRRRHPTK